MGSIPGWGTKIPLAAERLSLHVTTTEPASSRVHMPQRETPKATTTESYHGDNALQRETTAMRRPLAHPEKRPLAHNEKKALSATKTQHSLKEINKVSFKEEFSF